MPEDAVTTSEETQTYVCPYPGCTYSSSLPEAEGDFVQVGNGWYCSEHADLMELTLGLNGPAQE